MPTIYDAAIPTTAHALKALNTILQKAADHAQANDIDQQVLANARLFPDMLPLSKQVIIAADMARRGAVRLAGGEPEGVADTEVTLADLIGRVDKAIATVQAARPEDFADAEQRTIEFQARGGSMKMPADEYVRLFLLPNVYFHITTAYNILRHNGVKLGKADYLGWSQ